jgi:acyl phosphate:glycerol-3-phosphate acyltransferase
MPRMLLIAASSYLLGSIPFGYLLVRIFRGEDVRDSGSGNIGATNVSRTSPVLGSITLIMDALKGAAAVLLAQRFSPEIVIGAKPYQAMAAAAFFAVLGHIFPIWLKFRGGKGVATALGSLALITPQALIATIAVFVVVVAIFRYVSLGSIVSVGCFPFFVAKGMLQRGDGQALGFLAATSLLIIARHQQNIHRLFEGTENRVGARRA